MHTQSFSLVCKCVSEFISLSAEKASCFALLLPLFCFSTPSIQGEKASVSGAGRLVSSRGLLSILEAVDPIHKKKTDEGIISVGLLATNCSHSQGSPLEGWTFNFHVLKHASLENWKSHK